MLTRVITALVVLALFLPAILWLPAQGWMALCAALTAWAAWEWARLAGLAAVAGGLYAAAVLAFDALAFAVPAAGLTFYAGAALFWIVGAPWLLKAGPRGPPGLPRAVTLPIGVVALPAVFLAMVELRAVQPGGPGTLLVLMAVVWISDSMAYVTGRAFGRRKLAPGISPGKSWEGLAGGLAGVAVYAVVVHFFLAPYAGGRTFIELLVIFLVLAVAGVVGDLMESLLKRCAGVKDSGKALPGHGGILDRVDALLPVLPLAALAYLHNH